MNGAELFDTVKTAASFADIIAPFQRQYAKRGYLFEKIWDIVIKLGFCPLFPKDEFEYYSGNLNTGTLKRAESLARHITDTRVFGKGAGGASDITLQSRTTGRWAFISCKFFSDDKRKFTKDYDIGAIMAAAGERALQYPDFDIYLLVNNKEKVKALMRASQETSDYLTTNVFAILDATDLEQALASAKAALSRVSLAELDARFCAAKIPLALRFHQDMITHKQMAQINSGAKDLLLGAKARSGKTYCVGGLFAKYNALHGALNALVITPAPSETISQFTDDMFRRFSDFSGITVIEIKKGTDFEGLPEKFGRKNIVIASKQLLDDFVGDAAVRPLADLLLDFIVFDENHFGGTTAKSRAIMRTYRSPNTVAIYLTATYAKPLAAWAVPDSCQHFWDIEDEQMCKRRDIAGLTAKHGSAIAHFVDSNSSERVLGVYDTMPDLHIITTMMDASRYAAIKARIADTSYGFSNSAILSISKGSTGFMFESEVDLLLSYISGQSGVDTEIAPIRDHMAIFERVRAVSAAANSRTRLSNGNFTTQLWFLPVGPGSRIDVLSAALAARMQKNRALTSFDIMIVNSKKEYALKDVKASIRERERAAKAAGKAGLILLAGSQLTLGITLPYVDMVVLLNDTLSCDKVVQMMYRCMTEGGGAADPMNGGAKKMGFVIDLNLSRVLNTLMDYEVRGAALSADKKISYMIENNLICIDADLFRGKENQSKLIERLMGVWRSDPVNHLKVLLRKIEEAVLDLDTADQRLINANFAASLGDKGVNVRVAFDEDAPEALATGVVRERESDAGSEVSDETAESVPIEVNVSLTKDVLPFLIPLSCILTIRSESCDFRNMLSLIKASPELLCVFRNQSLVWWSRPDIIAMVEQLAEKYIKVNSPLYDIAIQFKMSLQSLIDRPKELLELIDGCLKPKQKEKQENGEVFTPMSLVGEMLDKLEAHYMSQNKGKSIFTEPTFKWFDPAAGMGNFPVAVYLRLMNGLKELYPSDEERKKHIVEHMLYMAELNAKNCFVMQQIFNIDGILHVNLYEGDTLEMDTTKEWGISDGGFDVVLGNPPFNRGGIRSHTGSKLGAKNETLWPKFIEKSLAWLKPDGFLVFINPLSWLKRSHSMHSSMLEKHVVWLKIWDDSYSKQHINADIPISIYVLQNTRNTEKYPTSIASNLKRSNSHTTSDVLEYLDPEHSIPFAFHGVFNKLARFIEDRGLELTYSSKTVKSEGTKSKIPKEYVADDMWAIDTFTIKDGLMVKRATEEHPDADVRKLIIANKSSFNGVFIDNGRLGLTGSDKFYIIGDNLELIQKMLKFKICNMIVNFMRYRMHFLERDSFKYIPDIRKLGIIDIEESEFYALIGLTEDEITQLKNM